MCFPPLMMGVLQQAAILGEGDKSEALAKLVPECTRSREDQTRLVVWTLINILPNYDERRFLEGFLASWDMLPEVPRQERLL